MSASDNALVVAAVAQVVAAGGTLYLALKTRALATKTGDLATNTTDLAERTTQVAKETARAADAGVVEAQATLKLAEETVRDRELAWQPILAIDGVQPKRGGNGTHADLELTISNVGRGPVWNVVYASWSNQGGASEDRWCYIRGFSLKEGATWGPTSVGSPDGPSSESVLWELFAPKPGDNSRAKRVLICSDVFGNRYRFTDGEDVEVSRRGDLNPPIWAVTWRFGVSHGG